MLVTGDVVDARELEDGRTVVDRVHPRASRIERQSAGGRKTVMAANIEALVAVAALVDPPLRLELVDRLIAFAEHNALEMVLVFTKADLAEPGAAAAVAGLYTRPPLGYPVLTINPRLGTGVDEFRAHIAGRHALLVGASGVGKSSLFGKLGGTSVVGEVSRAGRGRQTTSAARLFSFADGFLVDSPGIGEFVLGRMEPAELVECFRDLREPATRCRFRDCRHVSEPGCGVRAAVEAGSVAPSRYASYLAILAEAAEAMVW
jgi:ribosome biogenesis GTPase